MRQFHFHRLDTIDYAQAHELQKKLVAARVAGKIGDTILLLEHPPVFTLGRAAKEEHILTPRPLLEAQGIDVHEVGRGGDVTYHGPGQLVGYPIIDLKPDRQDVRKYVATLEETMIRVCAEYNIEADRIQGLNGTWVGDNKIGAVGVRLSRWVTMHGFGFNVNTDLGHFEAIVPCGIQGKGITSLQKEVGTQIDMEEVADHAAKHFASQYDARIEWRQGPPQV